MTGELHHVALQKPKTMRQPTMDTMAGKGCANARTVKGLYVLVLRLYCAKWAPVRFSSHFLSLWGLVRGFVASRDVCYQR